MPAQLPLPVFYNALLMPNAWAHLDVAGTAHQRNNPVGATGRPVPP